MESVEDVIRVPESVTEFLWNAASALAVLLVGLLAVRFLTRLLRDGMERGGLDATLTSFLSNLLYYGLAP